MSAAKRSVAPKHAPGAPRTPFALLVVGLIAGGMVALLALNTASAANEVRRHDLADSDQGISASIVELQNQVQSSAAPDNLAAAAAGLGMVPAGDPAFLQIDRSGRVKVLGSAAPASAVPVYVPPKASPTQPSKPTSSKPKPSKSKPAKSAKPKRPGANASSSSGRHPTPTGTAHSTGTAHPTGAAHSTGAARSSSAPKRKPKVTPPPTPTPTPTPVIPVPGGDR